MLTDTINEKISDSHQGKKIKHQSPSVIFSNLVTIKTRVKE